MFLTQRELLDLLVEKLDPVGYKVSTLNLNSISQQDVSNLTIFVNLSSETYDFESRKSGKKISTITIMVAQNSKLNVDKVLDVHNEVKGLLYQCKLMDNLYSFAMNNDETINTDGFRQRGVVTTGFVLSVEDYGRS